MSACAFSAASSAPLIGVLPGVGPIATITMLLPITFGLDPMGALIMLAGIYYGAQYGGSTTAILVNIPGEATSVVTTLDGHQMAKQGRAGVALGIAAMGSFFAGCVATIVIAALAAPLTAMALLFGPADYFALMVLGLMFAVVLARGSVPKAIAVILVGILLSTVGTDLESGEERLTFGWTEISDGLDVAVIAMGMFGFAEILRNLETTQTRDVVHGGHRQPSAQPQRSQTGRRSHCARDADRLYPGPAARQRRGAWAFRLLHGREEARQGPLAVRPRRHRGRCGARNPPTIPGRKPHSSRCLRSASRRTR